jgi:hypothetical protein
MIMERFPIEPEEMALRRDKDYIAKLKMIGEGGPVFQQPDKRKTEVRGYDEKELPRDYQ